MRLDSWVNYIRSGEHGRDRAQYRAESRRVPESLRVYMECRSLAHFLAVSGAACLLGGLIAVVAGPLTGSTVSVADALIVLAPGMGCLGVAALFWSVAVPFARQKADRIAASQRSIPDESPVRWTDSQ